MMAPAGSGLGWLPAMVALAAVGVEGVRVNSAAMKSFGHSIKDG